MSKPVFHFLLSAKEVWGLSEWAGLHRDEELVMKSVAIASNAYEEHDHILPEGYQEEVQFDDGCMVVFAIGKRKDCWEFR